MKNSYFPKNTGQFFLSAVFHVILGLISLIAIPVVIQTCFRACLKVELHNFAYFRNLQILNLRLLKLIFGHRFL